jgi:hypothetical protein
MRKSGAACIESRAAGKRRFAVSTSSSKGKMLDINDGEISAVNDTF